jgi:striatin 1/3/4
LISTFRGHSGPVTSVAISNSEDICFSGSLDATVRVWALPTLSKAPYSPHGSKLYCSFNVDTNCKLHTLIGHSDAVWEVKPHMHLPIVLSCSADGSLKLWDVNSSSASLKSTIWFSGTSQNVSSELDLPTSTTWGNGNYLVASYRNSIVKIFDAETGANTLSFASDEAFSKVYF